MSRNIIRKVLLITGIAVAAVTLSIWLITNIWFKCRYEDAGYYVERLFSIMPELTESIPEERPDDKMATYEVDGLNFAGVLEMPDYSLTLPVYGGWDTAKLKIFPCLFSGSPNNSDLILGSISDKALFGFVKQISVDDRIVFTDMTGMQFTYYITDIRHAKSADKDTLLKKEDDLILFIKDLFAFDYVIITASCNTDQAIKH